MADDDNDAEVSENILLARQLQARADQLRHEAEPLRDRWNDEFQRRNTELSLESDDARRGLTTARSQVKDTEAEVEYLRGRQAEFEKARLDRLQAADALDAKGDALGAEEERESADHAAMQAESMSDRAQAAQLAAAKAHETLGAATRADIEASVAGQAMAKGAREAEANIDRLEEQAALLEQARMKLIEADLKYGGDVPPDADLDEWITSKARLEGEAEALVERAERIEVDRKEITEFVGVDNDTDLMKPGADVAEAEDAGTGSGGHEALGDDVLGQLAVADLEDLEGLEDDPWGADDTSEGQPDTSEGQPGTDGSEFDGSEFGGGPVEPAGISETNNIVGVIDLGPPPEVFETVASLDTGNDSGSGFDGGYDGGSDDESYDDSYDEGGSLFGDTPGE